MVTRHNTVYRRLLERRLAAEELIRQQNLVAMFDRARLPVALHRVALTEIIRKYDKATAAVQEIE